MSRIVIDENRCKGCGLCTTACQFGLIQMADRFNAKGYRPAEWMNSRSPSDNGSAQASRCTGCANCAAMCPDVAITVYRTGSGIRAQLAHVQVRADAHKVTAHIRCDPAEQQDNRRNGRGRQTISADTHPHSLGDPTAPEHG
jgi:2-oxoglutarate ferredoxin oxidoreductase subunit delta